MKSEERLRQQLVDTLGGHGAHIDFDSVVKNFPAELSGKKAGGLPHTAWQLLEHMRIAQEDILEFCTSLQYQERKWPDDYWPPDPAPPDSMAWDKAIKAFRHDLKQMQDLIADPERDLYAPIPHGDGQTLLREALLVIDHNSYHLGQLVGVRQQLNIWPAPK